MQIPEIEQKNQKKFFVFLDNCIWIGSGKFSQFQRGYLPSAVTVLTDTPRIPHITKGDISKSIFLGVMERW